MCLAIPARVVEMIDTVNQLALVDVGGVRRSVNVGLIDGEGPEPGVRAGDWVLIHVGFALSRIDEHEALATLELLEQMGADYERELQELRAEAP